jgi:hypothetical protein
VLASAASYARSHGYHVGIAVLDTQTGVLRGAGDWTGIYASESLIKVFIATRLLVQHRMSGSTEARAWKMITQSDDAIASSFYGSVGGDGLINWIKARYHVPDLGYGPSRPGWWGNTHLRPSGLVKLYAKIKRDRVVAPWLLNAMHHARPYGSDGTWQYFGIPMATKGFAIKQGWGNDYEIGSSADFNTTGFVDKYRYAVAILARGPSWTYGAAISNLLTQVARRLLPSGVFPEGVPTVVALSRHSASSLGGDMVVVRGTGFTGVKVVRFGRQIAARSFRVVSPTEIIAVAPKHLANSCSVRVLTTHGISAPNGPASFLFVDPPSVTKLAPTTGPTAGGTTVVVTGRSFTNVTSVTIGGVSAKFTVRSGTQLRAAAPKHAAGAVDVRVKSSYGTSPVTSADKYTYADRTSG